MSALAEEDHSMARRKKHSPEEIVAKLRQVEVLTGQGTPVADAVRSIGVTEAAQRRAAQCRDLQLTPRGTDPDRKLASPLQYHPTTFCPRLSAAWTGGSCA